MESLIDQLTTNPVLLAVVIVLAVLILFSVIKKLMKLALVAVAVLALYLGYLAYTGKEVPRTPDELKETLQEKSEEVKEAVEKKVKEMNTSGGELSYSSPEPLCEDFHDPLHNLHPARHQVVEILAVDFQECRLLRGGDGRRPRLLIQKRHLTDELPFVKDCNLLIALVNPDGAIHDDEHGIASVPLLENDLLAAELPLLGDLCNVGHFLPGDVPEKVNPFHENGFFQC